MRALGLMSGTSLDGIDVAMIETDGLSEVRRGPSATYAYSSGERDRLRSALDLAAGLLRREDRPGELAAIERELTLWHARAVARFRAAHDLGPIDLLGFHGQTVLHRPEIRLTLQLGDGALLSRETGLPVIADLRAADVAAGGQGAPLVPIYHQALAAEIGPAPLAFLNIGGVANVTWTDGAAGLLAFDTGPGNALINDWCETRIGEALDRDGALAAEGRVDERAMRALLGHGYFDAAPPKSLDRNAFSLGPLALLSAADGAATLVAFTAEAVARATRWFPRAPARWIICGGGRRNPTLMAALRARLSSEVVAAEAVSLDGDALEAEAWAYLAVRSEKRLPITFPATTRAPEPLTGGRRFEPC